MRPSDMAAPFCSFTAGQVAEVQPLHGLLRGARRNGDVEAVAGGHLLQFLERADLLAQFLAIADDLVGRHRGSRLLFSSCLCSMSRATP